MTKKAPTIVAEALKRLRRGKLQCNQSALAQLLGVSLSTVAKWESGQVQPSPMACIALSKIDIEHREWWVARAGEPFETVDQTVAAFKRRHSYVFEDMLVVPILTAVIAAGHPMSVETLRDEYEGSVAIPLPGAGDTGGMVAARVRGDSMAPRIANGSIVVIDTRHCLPEHNVGFIVAARNDEGITIKTLRQEKGTFFLLAGNPEFEPQLQPVDAGSRWAIAGRVVKWICDPPAPQKNREG